ncbi:class I SAM-dependent methyltransferase [Thiomicrorhabdus indica]|uniref:class I SAM-dependent methyltransferase n=1 Tax=Thiomicrorhabdus indica TaxID=2267253 RepID=UPI002AA80901|nr:class I SAM-dependent methyltransferase [Thiomicrorhabdus indica]
MTQRSDTNSSRQFTIDFYDRLEDAQNQLLYQKMVETVATLNLSTDQFQKTFQTLFTQRTNQVLELLRIHNVAVQQSSTENIEQTDDVDADLINREKKHETYQLRWLEIDKWEKTLQRFLQNNTENALSESDLAIQLHQWLPLSLIHQNQSPVRIDFLTGKKAHRRQFGGGANQPLARAMGKLEDGLPTVLDATAGLGGDSFVLASCGFQVAMLERDPFVACLLQDALTRAKFIEDFDTETSHTDLKEVTGRLSFIASDSIHYLTQIAQSRESDTQNKIIDTIYLDPMYPEKKKNAATKKEMALLQQKVGPDLDSHKLLDVALKVARYRVVVKRPKNAPIIEHPTYQPTTAIKSPNTRYDIYVIKALKKH